MTNQVHMYIEHATPEQHQRLIVHLRNETARAVRSPVDSRVKEPILIRVYYPVADRLFRHLHPEPWWDHHAW